MIFSSLKKYVLVFPVGSWACLWLFELLSPARALQIEVWEIIK